MYYIPMGFEKPTLDGLIDAGALPNATSEHDPKEIKLLTNDASKETGPPLNFQIVNWKSQYVRFYLNLKWLT